MKKSLIVIFCFLCFLLFVFPIISSTERSTIHIKEMGRISFNIFQYEGDELDVVGYQVSNGKISRLPIGSTLDKEKGIFYWVPGPGFLGDFEFVFKSAKLGEEKKLRICISPKFGELSSSEVTLRKEDISIALSAQPFGAFSTPLDGSTVSSSIAVTGWALDDSGIANVKIYRGEINNLTYVGDAVLVEGARPDVVAEYPGYPNNTKAGWGYMMLTNFLPNGGNGTFKIHAIATATDGESTNLGAKTIYVDNANAVKPFGAIDTPSQGGEASGSSFRNNGWVITPLPNTIPTDGSTINVYIDGVDLGNPTYNVYRSDIASYFSGYNNSQGAHAYFDFDTTSYSNGVHTILWTAKDDAGNADGIGSRYFTIKNTGTSVNGTDIEVLTESTTDAITNVSGDGMTLTFDSTTTDVSNFEVGDFIVGGVSDTFPNGVLREITSVNSTSTSYTVSTQTASIEDAIKDADLSKTVQLTSADIRSSRTAYGVIFKHPAANGEFSLELEDVVLYDHDGNYNTTNDQVKLDGEISFSPRLDFRMKLEDWQLQNFETAFTFTADVEVIANASLEFDLIDKSITLLETYLTPITIPVPGLFFPIVITPKIEIVAGIKGEASASFQFGAGAGITSTIGVQYSNGNWSKIDGLEKSFYPIGPTLNAGLNVKGQVGPKFSLLLYGVTGPYFNVNAYGELTTYTNDDPWWRLYGGFKVNGGVHVKILRHLVADYSVEIIDYIIELANSGGSNPTIYILDVTKGTGVIGTPDASGSYTQGTVVNYSYSLKEGYKNLVVKMDGSTVASSGSVTMNANHTLTATANTSQEAVTFNHLLLVYPNTTVAYKKGGQNKYYEGSIDNTTKNVVINAFKNLPNLIMDGSNSIVSTTSDIVEIDHPVTKLSVLGGDYYWLSPEDINVDISLYAPSRKYDSVHVLWNNGPIDTYWGLGGVFINNGTTTYDSIIFGSGWWWTGIGEMYGEPFLHEWLHGVCRFYASLGYDMPESDADGASSHGYSKSATEGWMPYYRDLMRGTVWEPKLSKYTGITSDAWQSTTPRNSAGSSALDHFSQTRTKKPGMVRKRR